MIHIDFLGLKTIAKNEEDIPTAISELLECFYIASEKLGNGFQKEFKELMEDWQSGNAAVC